MRRLEDLTTETLHQLLLERVGFWRRIEKAGKEVQPLLRRVHEEGHAGLLACSREFDGPGGGRRYAPPAMERAFRRAPRGLQTALREACARIEQFHRRAVPRGMEWTADGVTTRLVPVPFRRVGLYVPAGPRGYPSTLLMTAIPAAVAGVETVTAFTPPRNGSVPEAVLAAAHLAAVDEVWSLGGAHAIAAMAWGTEEIAPVDFIAGPGGLYVTAAKYLVRDDVPVDMLAGPSEVAVICDETAEARVVAADLESQAEHDSAARAFLFTTSAYVGEKVRKKLTARTSRQSRLFLAGSVATAVAAVNALAPEHVSVQTKRPRAVAARIRNAGAVFIGPWSAVTFGDYCAGPSHVLPTLGTARSRGGLTPADFVKLVSTVEVDAGGFRALKDLAVTLAKAEGFAAHAAAVTVREGLR